MTRDPLDDAFLRLRAAVDAVDADERVPMEQVIDAVLDRLAHAEEVQLDEIERLRAPVEGVLFKCINQRVFVASSNLERVGPLMDAVDGFHFLDADKHLRALSDRDVEELGIQAAREALLEKCANLRRQVAEHFDQEAARANTRGWNWSTCWLQRADFAAVRNPL